MAFLILPACIAAAVALTVWLGRSLRAGPAAVPAAVAVSGDARA